MFLGISAAVHAAPVMYPASICIKAGTWVSPVPVAEWAGVRNHTSDWMYVDCAIPKTDFDGFLHNGAVEQSIAYVADRSSVADVHCAFYAHWKVGKYDYVAEAAGNHYSSQSSDYTQYLSAGYLDENTPDSDYFFSCQLPPANWGVSELISFKVDQ